jgi:CubicO group peptidase (beta-lactamase class C family)
MASIFYYLFIVHAALFVRPDEPSRPAPAAVNPVVERTRELIADRFDSLFTVLSAERGFNGNVLISRNGQVVYKNAFGYSDLKRKTPLSIGSVFQLASVSKQFTSVAIMILHDHGKLEFSDTVQKFFPDFPYHNITIRDLLAHRSGLPNYMYFAGKYWPNKNEYLSNASLMEMMTRYAPKPEFPPDQRYRYSNTGYAVLAAIVEKVSGMSFGAFMEYNVFAPLGMRSTYVFNHAAAAASAFQTIGYNKDRRPAHEDFLSGVVGDKGIYSTVEDMFKWDTALYTDAIVKQSTLEEAFTPVSYDARHDSDYGYGWRLETLEDGSKVIYHAGWWRGYNSLYVRRLEDKTFIIVLSNKVNWSFRNIGRLLGIIDSTRLEMTTMGGD